jgi:hypothetical protein
MQMQIGKSGVAVDQMHGCRETFLSIFAALASLTLHASCLLAWSPV